MSSVPFTEEDLHELYLWVDGIPISRPKRNIARDFADGCCLAEIVKYYFPKLVELHNYAPAMSINKKRDNWRTLNTHVFRKLYFEVPDEEIEDIIAAVPGAIERFLRALRIKITQIKAQRDELQAHPFPPQPMRCAAYATPPTADSLRSRKGTISKTSCGVKPIVPNTGIEVKEYDNGRRKNGVANAADHSAAPSDNLRRLLDEKDRTILELRETVGILSEKIMKLEELLRVKDDKMTQYRTKFGRI
ncbi:unnamed protein product [Phytomonas sp. Hart1]|nr:unnamed protein product [Phytomonas sp. Hart1]|eukprot:CCW66613.1 unnamed protein product [Phytomonas sp. isolate Hart1]